MKHLYCLFLFFSLLPFGIQAQSGLSGNITDASGKPFEYCKLILAQDSVNLFTIATDSLGNYRFENLADGDYRLRIKVPFNSIDTLISVTGPTAFSLAIDEGNSLDEVEIVAKQPMIVRKVDRTIFNPADIPALNGGNATDVIEFAPGVFIKNDNIQLSNGRSAQVMLNDKLIPLSGPQLIAFIRSIPTEDIQYIEIIPIPPVKYAASISSGLINIRLVLGSKSRRSNGSINGNINQAFYSSQSLSGSYNYRSGKFSLYSNLSLDNYLRRPVGWKTIDYDTLNWDEKIKGLNNSKYLTGSVGLNYEINPSTEIGILGLTTYYLYRTDNHSRIEKTGANNAFYGSIDNNTDDLVNYSKNALTFSLSKKLDTLGKKLDFIIDYTNYANNQRVNYETAVFEENGDSLSSVTNRIKYDAHFLSGGIDYVFPKNKWTFTMGARYSYTVNSNSLSVFNNLLNPDVADTTKSNDFDYFENIQAGYVSVERAIKRWSFQFGLRGENTMYIGKSVTTGIEIGTSYFQLVPKIFAMYESKKGLVWNFNYSRDFYRPSYSDLNPFRYYTSAYSYSTGNPYLKPWISHSLSVSTTVKDISFNLFMNHNTKGFSSVTIFDNATQLQQTTFSNLYTDYAVGFYINYFKTIKKRFSIDLSCLGLYSKTVVTQTIAGQNINNLATSLSAGFNVVLDKRETFTLKTYAYYMSPFYQQITKKTEIPYIGFSLKKNFLKDRMSVKFSMTDPFKIATFKSTTRSNETVVNDYYYYDTGSVSCSFTYNFGNKRLNVNQHRTNSTGEAGRTK